MQTTSEKAPYKDLDRSSAPIYDQNMIRHGVFLGLGDVARASYGLQGRMSRRGALHGLLNRSTFIRIGRQSILQGNSWVIGNANDAGGNYKKKPATKGLQGYDGARRRKVQGER